MLLSSGHFHVLQLGFLGNSLPLHLLPVVLRAHKSCDVYVTGGGLRKLFRLEQMHFHWGSEHLVNGYR